MNKNCGIYAIVNQHNGKIYVGQSAEIKKRFIFHKWELKNNRHNNGHLQNAWNKYDGDFIFTVIEYCPAEKLDEREQFWIERFKSNDPAYGYNLTIGGDGIRGLVRTEEHCKHLSESLKGRKSPMLGKKFSEEHRKKIAAALKGNSNMGFGKDNHASKPVICVETGERFESAADAGRAYGCKSCKPGVNIRKVCIGERKIALGHTWQYA